MASTLSSFFVTQNFDAAWSCYQDWQAFQQKRNLNNQVGLAGCRINGHICWDVCITQALHDARVTEIDAQTAKLRTPILQASRWGLFIAVPLAVAALSGGAWRSSTSQQQPVTTEMHEEPQQHRSRKMSELLSSWAQGVI
jgi:hypothetical protein